MNLHLPQHLCRDLRTALEREWLVTNGLGGFAGGTVAGALTRRYHGLLLAALQPPVDRRLLVTKLDDTAVVERESFQLYTNVWESSIEQPSGIRFLDIGMLHEWDIRVPVAKGSKALEFTISSLGDWNGPWKFSVPLG